MLTQFDSYAKYFSVDIRVRTGAPSHWDSDEGNTSQSKHQKVGLSTLYVKILRSRSEIFLILFSKDITSNQAMLMHIMLCQECAARRKQAFPQTTDNCQMRKVELEKNLESEGAVKRRLSICLPSKMNQSHRWYEFSKEIMNKSITK